ncbi:hypothetical protein PTTG_30519, partial [Puccinia triticina 1-1 BBBD Race 1]
MDPGQLSAVKQAARDRNAGHYINPQPSAQLESDITAGVCGFSAYLGTGPVGGLMMVVCDTWNSPKRTTENEGNGCTMPYCDNAESPIALACGHHYHKECISPWLRKRLHCPLCRGEVTYEFKTELTGDFDFEAFNGR